MQLKVKLLGYFVNYHKLKLKNYVTLIDPNLNEIEVFVEKKKQKIYFRDAWRTKCLFGKQNKLAYNLLPPS
jgi:hypothetical protein